MVPAGGDQPVTVLVPTAVHHCALVSVNGHQHLNSEYVKIHRLVGLKI